MSGRDTILTAGQRTKVRNFLIGLGATTDHFDWLKARFVERFGHTWGDGTTTRGEAAQVIRFAVKRRFKT